MRSCPPLAHRVLIFTFVFSLSRARDTRDHINTVAHTRAGITHVTHALGAVSGVRGGVSLSSRCLVRVCVRVSSVCARATGTCTCARRHDTAGRDFRRCGLCSLFTVTRITHTRTQSPHTSSPTTPREHTLGTLRAHISQTPGGGDGGDGATRLADRIAAVRGQQRTPEHQPPSQPPSHVAACHGRCGAGAGPDRPRPRERARASSGGSRRRGSLGDRRPSRVARAPSRCARRPRSPRQQQLSGATRRERRSCARSWGAGARRWARRARSAHAVRACRPRRLAARACGGLGWRSSRRSPEARRTRGRRE